MSGILNKREVVAAVLGNRLARNLSGFKQSPGLYILAYHRVLPGDSASFPYDQEVISSTPEQFRSQMKFVRENFDVVTFRDLDSRDRDGKPWPSRCLIITFDDGYRDNFDHAYPVLREFGLPATIFLTTDFMDGTNLSWWDEVAFCIKRARVATLELPDGSGCLSLESDGHRRDAISGTLNRLKTWRDEHMRSFVGTLRDRLDVEPLASRPGRMFLRWDEVRKMVPAGIEFGSHTVSHPILTKVTGTQLERELGLSKRRIEDETGIPVMSFAYPSGRYDEATLRAVKRAGYGYAVAYHEGVALGARERYRLPRIHVERADSMALFRARLMFSGIMIRGARTGAQRAELVSG